VNRGEASRELHRALAAIVLAAGTAAAFVSEPRAGSPAETDARRPPAAGEVTALELAAWIRDRKPGLRIVDLRPAEAFADGHVPSAENLALPELEVSFPAGATLVFYGGGEAAAPRAPGHLELRGGWPAWVSEVLNPQLARGAAPQEVAAFAAVSELSRYFGGVPRVVDTPVPPPSAAELEAQAVRTRRRGC
jgi:hypothetical protein